MPFVRRYEEETLGRAAIDGKAGLVLLEFGTDWCGHCKAAQPAIEAALMSRADVTHLKVEDGKGRPLGRSFRVKLWPTLVLLRDGNEVARIVRPIATRDVSDAFDLP